MKKWGALVTLSLAMFIIVIDTTIMNVSISALIVDLNTTVSGVQSAISIYALVMAAFILIGAKLSDIFGKKRIFVIGLIVYGVGTTMASLSTSLGMLIIGWSMLEGIGGSLMIPNIQVLLRGTYQDEDLAFSYGMIGAVGAIGAAIGPIVGGFFTTYYSWRWAFRTELVIVIIVLVLSRYLTKDEAIESSPKFDFVGAGLSVLSWSSIVLGILLAQTYGFFMAKRPFLIGSFEFAPLGLSITPVLIGLGAILVIFLFRWESRQEESDQDSLFKPSILNTSGIKSGFAVRFVHVGLIASFLYIYPLLLQLSFEYTAMETGVALMPYSLSLLVLAIVGSKLATRFTAKRIIQVGFILALIGLLIIGFTITPESTAADLSWGAILGAGLGLIASQILNLILSSVSVTNTAEAAGLTSTFEQLGNAIGVALVGTIMLSALSFSLQQQIRNNSVFPIEIQTELVTAVESGVQLMSNSQLESKLTAVGADQTMIAELKNLYGIARTSAFESGIGLMLFVAILGLIFTSGLPNRKLVA